MAGYTRQASANITTGSVIDADDFNDEYNQIQSAFNASTGHTHDGTAAEGAPITKVGPSQDLVITASVVRPKTNNTLDLGTTSLNFKDAFFDGTVRTDILTVDETSTLTGNVSMGGTLAVTGNTTVGGTLGVTGQTTVQNLTVGGTFSGSVPASSLTGTLPANQITVITQNMDSDDVSEGSSNQYHTAARARSAISVGAGLSYDSSTGVITNTNPSAATVNNATITIAAGSNLTGGGSFTTNQSSNQTITLNASAAASPGNGLITISAGSGLTGGGSFYVNQSGNSTITLNNSATATSFNSVGSLGVGNVIPGTSATGTYTHSAGSNYSGSTISFGGTAGSGTWKCLSPAQIVQTYNYNDNPTVTTNATRPGLYQRIS